MLIIATNSILQTQCDENGTNKSDTETTTNTSDEIKTEYYSIASTSSTTETLPLLEDLMQDGDYFTRQNDGNNGEILNDKSTAKRTISSKFTGPIIVNDDVNLFTPANELPGRQINVQILEPDTHNNGQFLKQTVYTKTENNTILESKTTTTTTTERPMNRRKSIVIGQRVTSSRYVAPLIAARTPNCAGISNGCTGSTNGVNIVTEGTARKIENVDIKQTAQVSKVIFEEPANKQYLPFGTRFTSTTKSPCQLNSVPSPCSTTVRTISSTPTTIRVRPINTTPILPPRVFSVPTPTYSTTTVPPAPVYSTTTTVAPQPIFVHRVTEVPTVRFIEKPVAVEKVVKEIVRVPGPTVERIVPVEVEKVVVKEVEVPINTVVEKHISHPPQVIEKLVPYPVHNVVQAKPIEIEKVVHKEVPFAVPVDRIVERPVPVHVRQPMTLC